MFTKFIYNIFTFYQKKTALFIIQLIK